MEGEGEGRETEWMHLTSPSTYTVSYFLIPGKKWLHPQWVALSTTASANRIIPTGMPRGPTLRWFQIQPTTDSDPDPNPKCGGAANGFWMRSNRKQIQNHTRGERMMFATSRGCVAFHNVTPALVLNTRVSYNVCALGVTSQHVTSGRCWKLLGSESRHVKLQWPTVHTKLCAHTETLSANRRARTGWFVFCHFSAYNYQLTIRLGCIVVGWFLKLLFELLPWVLFACLSWMKISFGWEQIFQ